MGRHRSTSLRIKRIAKGEGRLISRLRTMFADGFGKVSAKSLPADRAP
jgi:hypothetical protein